jgi:hypothetical protein
VPSDEAEEERVYARHAGADERDVELDARPECHSDAFDCSTGQSTVALSRREDAGNSLVGLSPAPYLARVVKR